LQVALCGGGFRLTLNPLVDRVMQLCAAAGFG
jgi:hypothetical protein